ncbi:MAG: DUF2062 domain-containing protein, partial [Candidatus Omnitrophica bacterium]|nr:DUF2062 domain-containing protein [Candidatus Omnitrophota bacterium]
MKKKISHNILNFLKLIYVKLFKIHDAPQKIALGFGLGVFLGIFPGTGPIAALFLAWRLKINRASALLGSLLTNTWLSIVIFLLSIKFGLSITQFKWQKITHHWLESLRIIFPILL